MKKSTLALLFSLALWSCTYNDVSPNQLTQSNQSNQIVGVWKLIQLQPGWGNPITDYSNDNILFDFRANETLLISGAPVDVYPNGQYGYSFGLDYIGPSGDPKVLIVKFNNLKWTYELKDGKMTLGQSYLDGPNLIFVKD